MNRIYSVVFNHKLGIWQCVSELARNGKKRKSCQSTNKNAQFFNRTLLSLFCFSVISGSTFALDIQKGETVDENNGLHIENSELNVEGTLNIGSNRRLTVTNNGTGNVFNGGVINADRILLHTDENTPSVLNILSGGRVNVKNLITGLYGLGSPTINISGQDAVLEITEELEPPRRKVGLNITDGGKLIVPIIRHSVNREVDVASFDISVDNGTIKLTDSGFYAPAFDRFGEETPIKVGKGGLNLDSSGRYMALPHYLVFKGEGDVRKIGEGDLRFYGRALQEVGTFIINEGNAELFLPSERREQKMNVALGTENIELTISNDNGMTLTNNSSVSGKGSVVKKGFGDLYVPVKAYQWQGETKIEEGGLTINGDFSNKKLNITVAEDTQLTLDTKQINAKLDEASQIKGEGSIVKAGDSTISMSAETLQLEGTTQVDNGGLEVVGSFVDKKFNFDTKEDTTLIFDTKDQDSSIATDSRIWGVGALVKKGKSTLAIPVSNYQGWEGNTVIQEGKLEINGDLNYTNLNVAIKDNAALVLNSEDIDAVLEDTSRISGAGELIKQGMGSVSMLSDSALMDKISIKEGGLKINGDYTSKKLSIDDGQLEVDGDFTMSKTQPVSMSVRSMTDYAKILATGNVDVTDGLLDINVVQAAQLVENGQLAEVIKGDSRTGELASVTSNSQLFNFQPIYETDAVHLGIVSKQVQPPINPPVTPPVNPPVTPPVNPPVTPPVNPPVTPPVNPPVTPPVNPPVAPPSPPIVPQPQKCDTVQSCVAENHNELAIPVAKALDQIFVNNSASPLVNAFLPLTSGKAVSDAATQSLPLHFGTINTAILASNKIIGNQLQIKSRKIEPHQSVWAKVVGQYSERYNLPTYHANGRNLIVGADWSTQQGLIGVAASVGKERIRTEYQSTHHQTNINSWHLLGYGNYQFTPSLFSDLQIGVGRSEMKATREIPFANATAKADYSALHWQAGVGLNYRLGHKDNHIEPFIRIDYADVRNNAYTESGANGLNLSVAKGRQQSLVAKAGFRLEKAMTDKLAFNAMVAVGQNLLSMESRTVAAFASEPNHKFQLKHKMPRFVSNTSVGMSYKPMPNLEFKLQYQNEWQKGYRNQIGQLNVSWLY